MAGTPGETLNRTTMAENRGTTEPSETVDSVDVGAFFTDAVTGMALVGLDGRFKIVNQALCDLLGYTKYELVGRSSLTVTHPDDVDRSRMTLDRLGRGGGRTDQVHKRYIRKDGSEVSVIRTTTVLRDRSGTPSGLFTQVIDVTPLTVMQEVVRQSESRFRALVAHSSELTLLINEEARIFYSSPACTRILGYSAAEMEGHSAFDFLHPDELPRGVAKFAGNVAGGGHSDPAVYRAVHKNGERREVEVETTSLFDDPAVGALVLNVRDVTDRLEYERQLEAGARRFKALVGASWDIISLHDVDGRYLYCSSAVAQLGYCPDEIIGLDPFAFIHRDDTEALARFQQVARGTTRSASIEYRVRRKDGSWRWMESAVENRLDDSSIAAIVVTTRDITLERRRTRQQDAVATLGSEALRGGPVENLLDRVPRMIGDVLEVPHCFLVRFETGGGHTVVAATDEQMAVRLFSDGGCALAADAVERRVSSSWDASVNAADPGFEALGIASAAAVPVTPANGPTGVLAAYSPAPGSFSADDITFLETVANILAAALTRRNVEDQLRRQAVHDELTGLPNRALLLDRLETALARLSRRNGSIAVLFVDVDNFKLVNDSLGHSTGDSVVVAVARRLRDTVRAPDTVGRFGGDEFVVICEDTDDESTQALAARIHESVRTPIHLADGPITVTASVGVALTADPDVSPEALMADADMAMYEAKQTGKDRVAVFTPELRRRTTDQLNTISGIRRGLAEGEFRLYYQPIVDIASGEIAGHEALIRWQNPSSGLLAPQHFIDYAESSGLIIPMGEWVLRTACQQSTEWRRAGRPSSVSINVSGVQLTGSDLVATVKQALLDFDTDPSDVNLEVTESAVMSDLDRARTILQSLRDLGAHIGMDDFGTGWSSLSQLARLPVDFLKIDKSFVRDLENDDRSAAMVDSILALCNALHMEVIVEGVETQRQLDHLKQLDVRLIQGYLFGRPQPPALL
jgi:diguanylate cyclase (GGDEF)-like protein/PAS domain S-box-containing protein